METDSKRERTVAVMVPLPAPAPYSYAVPPGMSLAPGDIVEVPLGPRKVNGIVWDGGAEPIDRSRLKTVIRRHDVPAIDFAMRRFIDWIAEYTLAAPGMVARMLLRVPGAFRPEAAQDGVRATGHMPERMTDARRRVLDHAADGLAWTRPGLAHAAGVSPGVVDGLIAQGSLAVVAIPPRPVVARPEPGFAETGLSPAQKEAATELTETVRSGDFSATLIDGVTGSGKTEVYFEAVAEAVRAGRQVLILLPEIALTQVFLERFEKRFGARPAEWHSELPPRQRERVWRQVAEGRVRVVAGARSALFLPFAELGLIVVDEEHDLAYKQEDRVFYNARDMAVVRARLGGFAVVLASATPSVESRVNALRGRYRRIALPMRYGGAALPKLAAIDMRRHTPERDRFLSPVLIERLAQTFAAGRQSLLFLNRRGYAPLTLCRMCGHRFQCRNCSSWLVEHRFRGRLACHHCGHDEPRPEACPECGAADQLVACGPGVERIAEEAVALFPEARILVMSSDMTGGIRRLRLELEAIERGEADIIIGTQLVAKGHNFPGLTLVGIVDADIGLANGDPRAAERTFQMLSQVTGRAGRTGEASLGLLQTWQPDHPVIRAIVSGDHDAFYAREIAERERSGLPPFGRLAAIIVSAPSRAEAESYGRTLRAAAPAAREIEIFGPAEAPMALVRGRHRFRLLVHATRSADVQAYLRTILANAARPRGGVQVQIDVDPQSFL